ncbi:Polyadenylate-binding protein-interacting protein 4 [Bienertia sinuspersici]
MGRMRESTEEETIASLSEALLFTTMCIIGLPVEVHIKDGSIFSGIFHTASVDNGYGVVLKKARMIKKGTHNSNVSNGGLIDTLVVLPGDLVQVVAKGVILPADHISSCASGNDKGTNSGTIDSCQGSENGTMLTGEQRSKERQVGVTMHQEEEVGYQHPFEALKEVPKVSGSSTSLNDSHNKQSVHKENHEMMAFSQISNGSLSTSDASLDCKRVNQLLDKEFTCTKSVASEASDSVKTKSAASRNFLAVPAEMAPQKPLNRTAKESKLNPSAKVFSPSVPNFRSTPPVVPTVPGVAYTPNSLPAVQVAGVQQEVGIRPMVPRSSWSVKYVPYVASTAMNTDNGPQYNQPQFAGHIVTRAQPIRHGAQYQQIQALPPYVHPSHQNGMFGRPGQLVYVRPVTHDVIQAPSPMSQAQHPLLASHPIHVGAAKNEGTGIYFKLRCVAVTLYSSWSTIARLHDSTVDSQQTTTIYYTEPHSSTFTASLFFHASYLDRRFEIYLIIQSFHEQILS